MRKLTLFLFLIFQLSCTSVSYKSVPTSEEIYLRLSKIIKIDEDECFLIFTRKFSDENIKVKLDGNVIYNDKISTNDYRTAEVLKVKNSLNIEIKFEGIVKPVKITPEQMRIYKYIYVERKSRKIIVEFTNNAKSLEGKLKSQNI